MPLSGFERRQGELYCEGASLSAIAEKAGTPTYVYSGTAICDNYRSYAEALSTLPHEIHYAVKANSSLGVLALLAREGADGVLQVELDYVTARFRDFSPGEFVWRHSSLLRDEGFRRVITPPGMVSPYYDRVGFHRDGDVFVLDV